MVPNETEKLLHSRGNHKENKTIHKMGEIFANEVTDKVLISKIYKQLMWLNKNKQKNKPHNTIKNKQIGPN